jgi:hypothetical protein
MYIYIYYIEYKYLGQAKEIVVASVISAVSAKKRDSFHVSCHSCIFRSFLIFAHPRERGQICSTSKSKYTLKTTKLIYAVWLDNLRRLVGNVCRFSLSRF